MDRTTIDPDVFIESLPASVRADIASLDEIIREVMSGHPRVMWEGKFWGGTEQRIIGYGDYRYARPSGTVEWFMVGLAAQKSYISLYINAIHNGDYAVKTHASRIGKAKIGSASISFKSLDDIDLDVLSELLELARDQMGAAGSD